MVSPVDVCMHDSQHMGDGARHSETLGLQAQSLVVLRNPTQDDILLVPLLVPLRAEDVVMGCLHTLDTGNPMERGGSAGGPWFLGHLEIMHDYRAQQGWKTVQ